MTQDEFNFNQGRAEAKSGMDQAEIAVRVAQWQHDAGRWFIQLPVGEEFSADDVIKSVGLPDEGINRNNAIGAFFRSLAAQRFITWTGKTMKSQRVARHTGMNRIWVKTKG